MLTSQCNSAKASNSCENKRLITCINSLQLLHKQIMPKYQEQICGSSPVGQLFVFSMVATSLVFAESLATHPSSGINGRARRSLPAGRTRHVREINTFATPLVLRSSSQSETKELVINGDHSAQNDTIVNAVNKNGDVTIKHTSSTQLLQKSTPKISNWPQFDELDQRISKIALPCIANFAINPLIGAVDLFWVNRMGNALAVAGQAAANQVFSSAFWIVSFLPSGELCIVI